jgi:MFS family permease
MAHTGEAPPGQNANVPTLAPGFLAKERIIAPAGFNRWLVPPAALAIHLCIGMAYGFSVFWLPLSQAIGIKEAVAAPASASWIERILSTQWDWKVSMLGWVYTLFFVLLGSSTAIWGGWVERNGPRKAGLVSACCWCGGLVIAAFGVYLHQILLLWLGAGVIVGIGLGLGYISPVSTLIRWFPDRRGMATGMAIMGFGGGAMIGAPLADKLMKFYATPTSVGVWQTLLTMAAIYFVFMISGALGYRLPPPGWKPKGWTGANQSKAMITSRNVHVKTAWRTPQFWVIWGALCLNVSAGIGVVGMASPMLQEVFAGKLIGTNKAFAQLTMQEKRSDRRHRCRI